MDKFGNRNKIMNKEANINWKELKTRIVTFRNNEKWFNKNKKLTFNKKQNFPSYV